MAKIIRAFPLPQSREEGEDMKRKKTQKQKNEPDYVNGKKSKGQKVTIKI